MVIDNEGKTLMLLNSIHKSYEQFDDAMIYGREKAISLDEGSLHLKQRKFRRNWSSRKKLMEIG